MALQRLEHILGVLFHGSVSVARNTFLSPVFLLAAAVILILERMIPADPDQPAFSLGLTYDSLWLIAGLLFQATVVVAYVNGLTSLYQKYFSYLTLAPLRQVPAGIRFVLAVFLSDLLAWFQHWLKHKVPWFWQIHAIHHSQPQINQFTDLRFHFLEYIISRPIVLIPLMMLSIEMPTVAAFAFFATWQIRFYHANVRTDLGFLRYIFVTPQSHRIHHSIEARHRDMNFGVMFSFWDRLFRTQCEAAGEYPKTGIEERSFPLEKKMDLRSFIAVLLRQLFYPFQAIGRSLKHD